MRYAKWLRCAVAAGLLTGWTAACDFIEPTAQNPNTVPNASLDQLFVASQVNAWFFNEGDLSRLISVWMQQMAGTDRQYQDFDNYLSINESTATVEFARVYGSGQSRTGGGLLDLRNGMALADEAGRAPYKGILQVHEAFLMGMAASIWGDIPYSQAVNPEFPTPVLDDQAAVYSAVQSLLDDAISNLNGSGEGPGSVDFIFGGDADAWEAVAYTLKARFHLHLVEVDGNSRYQQAATAAANGVQAASGNWTSLHSSQVQESNLWNQFQSDRSGYISANSVMVELLDKDQDRAYDPAVDDDRLPIYFTTGVAGTAFEGLYIGSPAGLPPGDPSADGSNLNVPGRADYGQPVVSCWENHFILAEAESALGNDGAARGHLQAGLDCQEDYWGGLGFTIDLGTVDAGLAGNALFTEIVEQKYAAQFLNIDVWNDFKRNCLAGLIQPTPGQTEIPSRLIYPADERETNPNIPAPGVDPNDDKNDNDPNSCF